VPTLASGPIQKLLRKADRHPLLSTIESALPGHLGGIGEARLKTTTSLVYYRKDKKKNYYKTKNELQSQLNCRLQYSSQKNACPALPDVVCKQKSIMAAAFYFVFSKIPTLHHPEKGTILEKILSPSLC